MGSPDLSGDITIALRLRDGRVVDVEVRSTRPTDVARVLCGMAPQKALAVIPTLFTVCAAAHTSAALSACEEALGIEAGAMTRRARDLLCALEAIESHAFQVCVEWPRLFEREPALDRLSRVRRATSALRKWAVGDAAFARLGAPAVLAAGSPAELVTHLRAAADEIAPLDAFLDEAGLEAWASEAEDPIAHLLGAVLASKAADFGRTTAPLFVLQPARWFAPRLERAGFGAQPTLDGTCAEPGAIARTAHHPAVQRILARHGRGLLARLVARIADARALVDTAAGLAGALAPAAAAEPGGSRSSGRGTGVVDTARGPLAHGVEIDEGRVVAWRTVAPTEWTFHPRGVVREALLGASARDLERRARWLVAALDPCVPARCALQETSDA